MVSNPNKALWEKGDFTRIAAYMRESGEAVAKSLGAGAGVKALDLGCGDGTTALPLAKLGADVTGIDIASNLVAAGNRRAKEAGLDRLRCDFFGRSAWHERLGIQKRMVDTCVFFADHDDHHFALARMALRDARAH